MAEERIPRGGAYCPLHSGLRTSIDGLEKRYDELKRDEQENREGLDDIKKECIDNRERCQDDLRKEIKGKMSTKILLTVIGLILASITTLCGWYISANSDHLEKLEKSDTSLKEEMSQTSTNLQRDISAIRESIWEMKLMMKSLGEREPPSRLQKQEYHFFLNIPGMRETSPFAPVEPTVLRILDPKERITTRSRDKEDYWEGVCRLVQELKDKESRRVLK